MAYGAATCNPASRDSGKSQERNEVDFNERVRLDIAYVGMFLGHLAYHSQRRFRVMSGRGAN